jgi:hypothetical protein
MKIGTACGSNDLKMVPFFKKLNEEGLLDFLELHIKPNITVRQVQQWREIFTKDNEFFVTHIHPENGDRGNYVEKYMNIAVDVSTICPFDSIVFDPGIVGDSFKGKEKNPKLSLEWILEENMPYKTSFGDECVSYMPSEMPCFFTFDISHAWITANQLKLDNRKLVKDFFDEMPQHFHVTDCKGETDHLLLGTGEIDWSYVVPLFPNDATITIETDNITKTRKEDIVKDLTFFRRLCESYRPS